jgi:hypothetical protein
MIAAYAQFDCLRYRADICGAGLGNPFAGNAVKSFAMIALGGVIRRAYSSRGSGACFKD